MLSGDTVGEILKLLDGEWYLNINRDVRAAGKDPTDHFLNYGIMEGRDPNPLFSSSYYGEQHLYSPSDKVAPLNHYCMVGDRIGLNPHILFDTKYIGKPPAVKSTSLVWYFDEFKRGNIRNPHPLFDAQWYNQQHAEFMTPGIDPLTHYILYGHKLGLDPHPMFSTSYYMLQAGLSELNNVNALEHYLRWGNAGDLDPHPVFRSSWYRARYMQNLSGFPNSLTHFLQTGLKSGFDSHPLLPADTFFKGEGAGEHAVTTILNNVVLSSAFAPKIAEEERNLAVVRAKLESSKKMTAVILFNQDAISGGIFSIFSIAEEMRKYGRDVFLFTLPGSPQVTRYKRFLNHEYLLSFPTLLSCLEVGKVDEILLPEVLVKPFFDAIGPMRTKLASTRVNILNQNADHMPSKNYLLSISALCGRLSATTAHEKYSSQDSCNRWGIPIKHISTYMSYDDYSQVNFKEKNDLIVLSPDRTHDDTHVLEMLDRYFIGYRISRIESVHYELFKLAISRAKYVLTFGEGMDNYFIECAFTGGIPFTIYNPTFMHKEMKSFPNVFQDVYEMKARLPSLIRVIETDQAERERIQTLCYNYLKRRYDKKIYRKKLKEYIGGQFDFYPK